MASGLGMKSLFPTRREQTPGKRNYQAPSVVELRPPGTPGTTSNHTATIRYHVTGAHT